MATATPSTASQKSLDYLACYLNKTLHVHISDGRMFVGALKCTDNECNVILSMTHEYRPPSRADVQLAALKHERAGLEGNVKVDMKKRFVGLVVVPGLHIRKIELEG